MGRPFQFSNMKLYSSYMYAESDQIKSTVKSRWQQQKFMLRNKISCILNALTRLSLLIFCLNDLSSLVVFPDNECAAALLLTFKTCILLSSCMYRGKDVSNFASPAISLEGSGKFASLYQGKLTTISKEQESLPTGFSFLST